MFNRRCPLKSVRFPRVLWCHLAFVNTIEEVNGKYYLGHACNKCKHGYQFIDVDQLVESFIRGVGIIPSWHSCESYKVHRKGNTIHTDNGQPEVQITKCFIHHSAIHPGEPVINTREHPENCRTSHYDMEVCHYEVSVV